MGFDTPRILCICGQLHHQQMELDELQRQIGALRYYTYGIVALFDRERCNLLLSILEPVQSRLQSLELDILWSLQPQAVLINTSRPTFVTQHFNFTLKTSWRSPLPLWPVCLLLSWSRGTPCYRLRRNAALLDHGLVVHGLAKGKRKHSSDRPQLLQNCLHSNLQPDTHLWVMYKRRSSVTVGRYFSGSCKL